MEDTCIVQEVEVVYLSTLPLRDAMPNLTLKLVPALPSLTMVGPLISASLACCGPLASIQLRKQTLSLASSGCHNAPLLTIGRTQLHAHSTLLFTAVKLYRALCTHQWHALATPLQQYSLAVQLQPVAESAPMQLLQQQEAASAGVHAST
eukprot:4060-Heterococcus_DN1.PRE.1